VFSGIDCFYGGPSCTVSPLCSAFSLSAMG
jgi:hypothetical protein